MKKINLIILPLILLLTFTLAQANTIKIKVKIQNKIITNIDIENEKKYLLYLNPKLLNLEDKKLFKIAKESLVTEIIKKNELEKLNDFENLDSFSESIERNFLKNLKISKNEFLQILNEKELKYKTVRKKLQIEALWNQLVYDKFNKNIKIDKKFLRERILKQYEKNSKKYKYNLSEIFFTEDINENLDDKLKNISLSISEIGFENTANIFSESNSSKNGGLIGWINELQISEVIKRNISNIKINDISKPIKIKGGYLLIKINDKKEFKQEIDVENQVKELTKNEINRQLTTFSVILYKRLKRNTQINEF